MATFLLEIRTEEIPANALPGARRQLAGGLHQRLVEAGYEGFTVRGMSTSRRLIVIVDNLPERQADRSERLTGPPVRVAFAADGSPTKAAEGFARKAGIEVQQLERTSTDKGDYLAATVVHPGRPTSEILAEAVPSAVAAMRFPKTMRWGLGWHIFVRPVHGVVALLDGEVVPFELMGVASGRDTTGHRVHAPDTFAIEHAANYEAQLAERQVLVDPSQRRQRLADQATKLATEARCSVHPDPELVAEHVELVEHPGLLRGGFDPAFLKLPPEVVVITLRHHQKCLVLEDDNGSLAPWFLAVVDRSDDPEGHVQQGNEWVIGARLADARFFFSEDQKHRMETLVPGLERLEFHRVIGSLAAKADRVALLAAACTGPLGISIDEAELRRAAHLVKADLLTNMVGEFPELQGIMGGHYLRLEGAPEALWSAARDHYVPVGFEGEIPASDLGRLLGFADRLDTIAGLFAAGEIPSGSKDPFGLRRAAQGVVRIVAAAAWQLDLHAVLREAVLRVAQVVECDSDKVIEAVTDFLADRVRRYLVDVTGVAGDTADAVMAAGWSQMPDLLARAEALEQVRGDERFRALALAFKRVRNITEGQPDSQVDEALLEEPEERELHSAAQQFHAELAEHLPARRLTEAFAGMGRLAEVLDLFFDKVLVMAEDQSIRSNRIALLQSLRQDFLLLADLSRLQVEGGNK